METAPKTDSPVESATAPRVEFAGSVLQQVRQHARSSMRAEICGVLIGSAADGVTRVTARIVGEGASQGGAHVTFTQDTWEHIYKVKDTEFPSESIVGWYHSHPGFGIFLSDYDLFIHENFFNALHQVAWVFDPHSDEEGCFGWIGKKVEPLPEVAVIRKHRPPVPEQAQKEAESRKLAPPTGGSSAQKVENNRNTPRRPGRLAVTVIVGVLAFAGGVVFRPYLATLRSAVSGMIGVPKPPSGPPSPVIPTAVPHIPKVSGPTLPTDITVVLDAREPEHPALSKAPAGSTATPPPATAAPPLKAESPETTPASPAEKPAEPKPKGPAEPVDPPKPTPPS